MRKLAATIAVILLILPNHSIAQANRRPSAQNWLQNHDQNGDGKITRNEASGRLKQAFDNVDTSGDGALDRGELQQLAQRLAANNQRSQNNSNRRTYPTDAAVKAQAPQGVEVELDIAYREGNPAWRLDLARPKEHSHEPRAAIVFVHGGGWRSGDKRAGNFLGPALDYATKGYVTITVNYRLDRLILPCVEDVKCAVRWLRAHADQYHIDPSRIGAYGNSAGAHLVTMLGLSHTEPSLEGEGPWKSYSSRVQAVVASATPTLPRYGTGTPEVKQLVAPMSYISADAPPMLLVHDVSDRTVPVANADQLVKALNEAGAKDITYKRYDNQSGHGVFQRNKEETLPLMEAFFARTLQAPDDSSSNRRHRGEVVPLAEPRYRIPPTHANQKYGIHQRQVYDVWLAPSAHPTPVFLSIHGGGFRGGRRSVNTELLKQCLENGISVAALTYRFSSDDLQPVSFHDAARAVQTIRAHAEEWNLDPKQIVSSGGSAGAGISLWLAFHPDRADPTSPDPIARQSTRLLGAYVSNGQCTYDPRTIRKMFPQSDTWKHPALELMYDIRMDNLDQLSKEKYNLMEYVSPITHLSPDDPPVILSYSRDFDTPVTSQGIGIHHPDFGIMLKNAMTKLGIDCRVFAKQKSHSGRPVISQFEFLKERFQQN